MTFEQAILGLLAELEDYTTSEAWETCLACGCLCKPFEPCPGCEAARQALNEGLAASLARPLDHAVFRT